MNESDLRAAWVRWMHRRDIEADLDTVMALTEARIAQRLMYERDPDQTVDEAIAAAPTVWHHAGLMSLHQLAQDDEGLARERTFFDRAMKDHHFRRSLDTSDATMAEG